MRVFEARVLLAIPDNDHHGAQNVSAILYDITNDFNEETAVVGAYKITRITSEASPEKEPQWVQEPSAHPIEDPPVEYWAGLSEWRSAVTQLLERRLHEQLP